MKGLRFASLVAAAVALVCNEAILSLLRGTVFCSNMPQLPSRNQEAANTVVTPPQEAASSSSSSSSRPVFYSIARTDRTGAGVIDMLKAHLYAYENNMTYGGACAVNSSESYLSGEQPPQQQMQQQKMQIQKLTANQQAHMAMIQALGLDHILPFACPPPTTTASNHGTASTNVILASKEQPEYYRILNPEWLRYIRSQVKYHRRMNQNHTQHDQQEQQQQQQQRQVAVHIRRGDINYCRRAYKYRYLTNSYYLDILDHYLPKLKALYGDNGDNGTLTSNTSSSSYYQVSIYSERESFENWTIFEARNYTLHLDTDLIHDTFHSLLTADVLVLSTSTLSILAAILNPHAQLIISPPNNLIVTGRHRHRLHPRERFPNNWVIAEKEHHDMKENVAKLQNGCRSIAKQQQRQRQQQQQQQQQQEQQEQQQKLRIQQGNASSSLA
jgi:hypothetical protein